MILLFDHKKALFNAIICFRLAQITSESFISEVERFHQKGIVRISQRRRSVIILGKQLDKAVSMDDCLLESSVLLAGVFGDALDVAPEASDFYLFSLSFEELGYMVFSFLLLL